MEIRVVERVVTKLVNLNKCAKMSIGFSHAIVQIIVFCVRIAIGCGLPRFGE